MTPASLVDDVELELGVDSSGLASLLVRRLVLKFRG
jgi:hypothetical protein